MGKSLIVQTLVICLMGRWWVEKEKMRLIKENVWSGNPKKKNLWHVKDVSQLERGNNKYYALIYIYIYIYIY